MLIKRGDLFWVSLDPTQGSEQAGRRPALVIQNDIGNEFAATVIIAPLTTKQYGKPYPTNVTVSAGTAGIKEDSTVLLSQIRTIDKRRLKKKIGHLAPSHLSEVNRAIAISLGLSL